MFTKPSHTKCDDSGEADGFEEESYVEHGHAGVAPLRDAGCDEDDAHGEVEEEDPAWANELHEADAGEASHCKCTLSARKKLSTEG